MTQELEEEIEREFEEQEEWIGEPIGVQDNCLYYRKVKKNNRIYAIGDGVIVKNNKKVRKFLDPNDYRGPLLAEIVQMWEHCDGAKWLTCKYYFKPEQLSSWTPYSGGISQSQQKGVC